MSDIEIYDKAKWHSEHQDFPHDVGIDSSYLYGGFFLVWCHTKGFCSDELLDDFEDIAELIHQRAKTPGKIYRIVDGVLSSEMLNNEGQAFAYYCFDSELFDYYEFFETHLAVGLISIYYVEDSWDNFDKFSDELDDVYHEWLQN